MVVDAGIVDVGIVASFGAKGFVAGLGAKGLNAGTLGDPKGDAVAMPFGAKGLLTAGDAAAKGFGLLSG